MQFLTDLKNHIDQLENALEKSFASLPARVVATLKADAQVSLVLLVSGFLLGLLAAVL